MRNSVRVAINGFGRIGRVFFRACLEDPRIQVVAINELAANPPSAAHLLKYDSTHRTLAERVMWGELTDGRVTWHEAGERPGKDEENEPSEGLLKVGEAEIRLFKRADPACLDWKSLDVDVVLESTGKLDSRDMAKRHLQAGAKVIVYSSTGQKAEDSDVTLVYGVNHELFDPKKHRILANASCTTNCLASVCKVLLDKVKIVSGEMCTIHAYTADQRLWDTYHRDWRRARAAARSIVPTRTGAARAIGLVLPELAGRLDGVAYRVPTLDVSIIHLEVDVDRDTTKEEINSTFKEAAESRYKGIVQYVDFPLVSEDYVGNAHSAVVDADLTRVTGKRKVVVAAWYDNEWGYCSRLRDLIVYVGTRNEWLETSTELRTTLA